MSEQDIELTIQNLKLEDDLDYIKMQQQHEAAMNEIFNEFN